MNHIGWTAAITALLLSLLLTVIPLPETVAIGRPAFVPLVVVYLCLRDPARYGLGLAWVMGLLLDVAHSTLLGQHAIALTLATYLALKLRDTLKLFPAWQQTLLLLPIWAGYQGLLLWLDGFAQQPVEPLWRWVPVATTALGWLLLTASFALLVRRPHHSV